MAIYDAPESLHVGTGTETVFGFNWPYLLPRDLVVTVNGQAVPTVLASPNQVAVVPAPAALAIVRIYRNTPAQNPTYLFATGIPMLPKYIDGNNKQLLYALQEGLLQFAQTQATADAALEAARLAQLAAEQAAASAAQQAANIRRTIRVSGTDPELPALPPVATRANKVLGFDAAGNPVATLPASGSGTEVALDLANSVDPYKGAALVGVYDPVAPAFLKTVSDIINMVPVSIMRGIPREEWSAVRAGTSTRDVTAHLQALTDAMSEAGRGRLDYEGVVRANALVPRSGVRWVGANRGSTTIKAVDGWTGVGSVVESPGFDTYKTGATDENTPVNFSLEHLIIDGNAEHFGGVASATVGVVCRLASFRMTLDNVRVQAGPGVGLHTSLGSVTRIGDDWFRNHTPSSRFVVEVFGNRNDGWVFDGPADAQIAYAELGVNGWPDTVFTGSRPSLIEPGRRVANFVGNAACEIGWMHSFGCREGFGVVLGRPAYGAGSIRIAWETMISESCNAGIWLREGSYHRGGMLDLHNNYGVDGFPYLRDSGATLQAHIDHVNIEGHALNEHGQNKVELLGQRKSIGKLEINGAGVPGHGLVLGGFNNAVMYGNVRNCVGTAADGTPSSGVLIKAAASKPRYTGDTSGNTVGTTLEAGATNVTGEISTTFGNTTNFVGYSNLSVVDRRDISLQDSSAPNFFTNKVTAQSVDIPADSVAMKTINVVINGIYPPNPQEVIITVQHVSGTLPSWSAAVVPGTITATLVQVEIQFAAVVSGTVRISLSVP